MSRATERSDHAQPWWLRVAAVIVVLGTLGLAGLVISGALDPKPAGPVATIYPLDDMAIAAGAETLRWVTAAEGASRLARSWRLTAAHNSGELDSGYGLAIGDDDRALIVAVSPLGYAAVWERSTEGAEPHTVFPWQTWPHVATEEAVNEIWVDIKPQGSLDRVTVRINRELLWTGQVAPLADQAGLWATSFGDDTAVDFQELIGYEAPLTGTAR